MIKYILLLVIILLYCKTSVKEGYEGHESNIIMNCPEKYEIGIGEISKLNKYPNYVGYSPKEYYYLTLIMDSKEPLPSDPDFFK
tara:strand:- start:1833 stop:2084 length:252 start_codon:yes stop_codon:yes gene_type:complete